jgi:hypothetical protein
MAQRFEVTAKVNPFGERAHCSTVLKSRSRATKTDTLVPCLTATVGL